MRWPAEIWCLEETNILDKIPWQGYKEAIIFVGFVVFYVMVVRKYMIWEDGEKLYRTRKG